MKLNNKNILFMGDATNKVEKELLEVYNLKNMDILKVGHHGSKYSSSIKFIKKIKPHVSLISSGLNNKFGHPHKETLENLKNIGSDIYITSINGMIKIKIKEDLKIYTCL